MILKEKIEEIKNKSIVYIKNLMVNDKKKLIIFFFLIIFLIIFSFFFFFNNKSNEDNKGKRWIKITKKEKIAEWKKEQKKKKKFTNKSNKRLISCFFYSWYIKSYKNLNELYRKWIINKKELKLFSWNIFKIYYITWFDEIVNKYIKWTSILKFNEYKRCNEILLSLYLKINKDNFNSKDVYKYYLNLYNKFKKLSNQEKKINQYIFFYLLWNIKKKKYTKKFNWLYIIEVLDSKWKEFNNFFKNNFLTKLVNTCIVKNLWCTKNVYNLISDEFKYKRYLILKWLYKYFKKDFNKDKNNFKK